MGRKPKPRPRLSKPFDGAVAAFEGGALVEVRCDDEGFRGAWYEATVVRAVPGRRRRRSYSVVYDSLVADDDPSRHLSEVVPGTHVRPRPPRLGPGARYAFHQLVDAFHNDGWWAGVVSAVCGSGGGPPERYRIAFHSSREEFLFAEREIRPHVQWVGGRWILHEGQAGAGAGAKYKAGAEVEISCDKENYGAFWLLGVIEKAITKRILLVKYKKLKEDGGSEVVKEILDVQYIRPKPPTGGAKQVAPLTEVEVFYHGGWSAGVLLKILEDSKYIVKLKFGKEEIELCRSELRPRREWSGTQWHYVSKEKRHRRSARNGRKPSHPVLVSASSSSDVDNEATCESQPDEIGLKRKKEEGTNCEGQAELLKPCKLLKKGIPSDQLWKELGPRTPKVDKEIPVTIPNLENPPNKIASSLCVVPGVPKSPLFGDLHHSQTSPPFNRTVLLSSAEEASKFKVHGLEQQFKAPNLNLSQLGHGNCDLIVPMQWDCKGVRGPRLNAERRIKKLAVRGPLCQGKLPYIDVKQHAKEILKKRRGRPPKRKIFKDRFAHTEGTKLQQSDGTIDPIVGYTQRREDMDVSNQGVSDAIPNGIKPLHLQDEVMECRNSKLIADIDDNGAVSAQSNEHAAATAAFTSTLQEVSSSQENGSTESSAAPHLSNLILSSVNTMREVSNVGIRINGKGIEAENNALLPPFKESEFVTSGSFSIRVQEISCNGDGLNAGGNEEEDLAIVSSPDNGIAVTHDLTFGLLQSTRVGNPEKTLIDTQLPSVKTVLPFAKSSRLWESIESMEVFRIIPQQPHFCQLEKYYTEFREGMAIGLMVSFANLVTNVSKLQISDSETAFKETQRALILLEENGFDVRCLCSRIDKLLEIRNSQCQSKWKKTALEGQILERENENNQLGELTVGFDKSIMELEQHLACLREKRDGAILQRKSNESEIMRLQKDVQVLEEDCLSAEQRFETLVASSWQHDTT